METVYLGLGSNLDQPARQIRRAVDELDALPGVRLDAVSPLYANPPLGPADQPDYVNAVARLQVDLPPHDLLDATQALEARHGRRRDGGPRWGPRPLDIDILLYGQREIGDERLHVPHPGIRLRPFVYFPLWKIEPRLVVPGLGPLQSLVGDGSVPPGLQELS